MAKFRNCCEYFCWNEADKLFHRRASLDGPAGQLLWDTPKSITVEKIILLLQNHFGTANQAERYRAELRARKRQPKESLQTLYMDITRLMTLAYPGPTSVISDVVGRDAFLEALNDHQLRIRILDHDPVTMDDALRWASRIEAYGKESSKESSESHESDYGRSRAKYARVAR